MPKALSADLRLVEATPDSSVAELRSAFQAQGDAGQGRRTHILDGLCSAIGRITSASSTAGHHPVWRPAGVRFTSLPAAAIGPAQVRERL